MLIDYYKKMAENGCPKKSKILEQVSWDSLLKVVSPANKDNINVPYFIPVKYSSLA